MACLRKSDTLRICLDLIESYNKMDKSPNELITIIVPSWQQDNILIYVLIKMLVSLLNQLPDNSKTAP